MCQSYDTLSVDAVNLSMETQLRTVERPALCSVIRLEKADLPLSTDI